MLGGPCTLPCCACQGLHSATALTCHACLPCGGGRWEELCRGRETLPLPGQTPYLAWDMGMVPLDGGRELDCDSQTCHVFLLPQDGGQGDWGRICCSHACLPGSSGWGEMEEEAAPCHASWGGGLPAAFIAGMWERRGLLWRMGGRVMGVPFWGPALPACLALPCPQTGALWQEEEPNSSYALPHALPCILGTLQTQTMPRHGWDGGGGLNLATQGGGDLPSSKPCLKCQTWQHILAGMGGWRLACSVTPMCALPTFHSLPGDMMTCLIPGAA